MQLTAIRGRYLRHRLSLAEQARPICFTHVPKCGGISISRAIARQAFSLQERMILTNFNVDLVGSRDGAAALGMDMMELRTHALAYSLGSPRCKFAAGHVGAPPALVRAFEHRWSFVTVLRDPVSRWLSGYVYNSYKPSDWARVEDDIDTYLASDAAVTGGHLYVSYFSTAGFGPRPGLSPDDPLVDEAVENLARYKLVGALNDLDTWRRRFAELFGAELHIPRSNESPNREVFDRLRRNPDVMRRIEALCAPDLAVWRRAVLDRR
jgi:hypothetical protein